MIRNWIHSKWTTSNLIRTIMDENGQNLKRDIQSRNLLGRLPSWVSTYEDDLDRKAPFNVRKVNKYLAYQEKRLLKLKSEKRYHELVLLWCILLKNSKSYQITLFHSASPGWYWKKTKKEVLKELVSCINKCRRWDFRLTLKRFYLDKGMEKCGIPNGRLRPIGAPTIQSKVLAKSINNLIYFLYEDKFETFQHGYRKNKGTYTALFSVWEKIFVEKKTLIYEFDFKSFFNRVSPVWVHSYLRLRSWDLADLVIKMISKIHYKFDRNIDSLPEESEIHRRGEARWKNKLKPFLVRRGLPQGMPFSPILATLVLELSPTPEGLTMCADDGLVITDIEKRDQITDWLMHLSEKGIVIEPTKSGVVKDSFKFLGVEFKIKECTATFRESTICWKGWNLEDPDRLHQIKDWFKQVTQWYGKPASKWHWDIVKDAYCENHYINPYTYFKGNVWDKYLSWILFKSMFWEQYKGLRQFRKKDGTVGGILSISKTSTLCASSLLNDLKDIDLAKLGKLKFTNDSTNINEHYSYVNKKKYIEEDSWVYRLNREEPVHPMNSITPQSNIVLLRTITTKTKIGRENLLKSILGEQGWQH